MKPRTGFSTYKRLLTYVLPYKASLIVSFMALLGASAAHSAISIVTYITVNGLINKNVVTFAEIPHLPEGLRGISFSASWVPLIIVSVFLFRGLSEYMSKYLMSKTGLRAVMDIRNDLYEHITYLSSEFHSGSRSGDLISRIMSDVNTINAAVTTIIADCIKSPLIILWSIPLIFILGGKLALICVAIFPLVSVPIIILGTKMRKLSKRTMERNADITSFLQETFIGMPIVKAFAMEKLENEKFRAISHSVFDYTRKIIRVVEIQRPIIEVMGAVGIALTISYAMKTLTADRFMAFAASLFLLYEPFKKISKVNTVVQGAIASGNRIFEIIDSPVTVSECDEPKEIGAVTTVTFDHVSFYYEPEKPVLNDFSLTINKGEVTAFVGSSGAGKTTVMNLLLRFYDPQKGAICIDGVDIREASLSSLRGTMGLVTQDTILFNGTVAENIAYGKPEATREEVEYAAHAAHAHGFILEQLENGYETEIGERGSLLSGGQRQRLCIARAILKNPPILIFDEATSQLDSESEREVQAAIENLLKGRTVFVIAHRLSTIQNATRIVVLDKGSIVEMGDHKSLLAKGGAYKRFHDLQLG